MIINPDRVKLQLNRNIEKYPQKGEIDRDQKPLPEMAKNVLSDLVDKGREIPPQCQYNQFVMDYLKENPGIKFADAVEEWGRYF